MNKINYSNPKFSFQEMKLMERVADKCWGYSYAFVDHDMDPSTAVRTYYFTDGGCEGNAKIDLENRLNKLLKEYPALTGHVTTADVQTNIQSASPYINPPEKS